MPKCKKILVLSAMYPSPEHPADGTFVKQNVDSLIAAGLEVDVLSFRGSGSFLNYLKAGFSLRKKIKNGDYDLVHAHYGLTGLPARMQFKVPVVLTYHGSDLLGEVGSGRRYTFSGRLKVLLGQVMGLIVDQRTVVAPVLKRALWHRQADIIPMGIDMDSFLPMPMAEARDRLGLPADKRIILFLADPKNQVKRFDIAEKAVTKIQDAGVEVELLPVSGVSHEMIPHYLNAADVLVLTSNHEASPCVIKEAMACNLPIVSTDVGDVAVRILGVDGCYLCRQDPDDVAEKLERALAFNRRTQGREKVAEISLKNTARQTVRVFERALGGEVS